MKPFRPPPSNLIMLAVQWKLLGMMAILLARRISMASKQGSWGDIRRAQMLEAFLYTALVQISAVIADHSGNPKSLSKQEADALAYLRMVHALLSVITLLIRQIGLDLAQHQARAREFAGDFLITSQAVQTQRTSEPAALDSS